MAYKPPQFPVAKMVNPQIGLNALGSMGGGISKPTSGVASMWGNTNTSGGTYNPSNISSLFQSNLLNPNQSKSMPVEGMDAGQKPAVGGRPIGMGGSPVSQFAEGRQPPTTSIPTWDAAYKPYDPTTDPLMGAAAQAGQQQLNAGLMALQQTFGEQRKELEGRMFQGDLAGSGIEEALYGKQGRAEGQQTGQLSAEISAQTMLNQVDIMREGTDRAINLAQNEIDTAFKSGQLSIEEYNAYTQNLQAETDRLRALEDQKRTAIMEAQAFAPEGGEDYARRIEDTNPWLFGGGGFSSPAPHDPNAPIRGNATDGYNTDELFGMQGGLLPWGGSALGGGSNAPAHGFRHTMNNGTTYIYDAYTQRWYPA